MRLLRFPLYTVDVSIRQKMEKRRRARRKGRKGRGRRRRHRVEGSKLISASVHNRDSVAVTALHDEIVRLMLVKCKQYFFHYRHHCRLKQFWCGRHSTDFSCGRYGRECVFRRITKFMNLITFVEDSSPNSIRVSFKCFEKE